MPFALSEDEAEVEQAELPEADDSEADAVGEEEEPVPAVLVW